jgi:hypothetical protein
MAGLFERIILRNAEQLRKISETNFDQVQQLLEQEPDLIEELLTEFIALFNQLIETTWRTDHIALFKEQASGINPLISSLAEINKLRAAYKAMDRLVVLGAIGAQITNGIIDRTSIAEDEFIESPSKDLSALGILVASAAHAFEGYLKNIGMTGLKKDDFIHALVEFVVLSGQVEEDSAVIRGFREAGWLDAATEEVNTWKMQHLNNIGYLF